MQPKIITEAVGEPITLVEARNQCRLDADGSPPTHPDDSQLEIFIAAAREWAQTYTGRALATQTVELALDAFPGAEIELTVGPVQSIVSVTYVDDDEVEQTVDPTSYTLDDYSPRTWLLPASGQEWPTAGEFVNAVKIRQVVGYSLPGESPQSHPMPKSVKMALLLIVGHLYKHREENVEKALATIPLGARHFLEGTKIRQGMA